MASKSGTRSRYGRTKPKRERLCLLLAIYIELNAIVSHELQAPPRSWYVDLPGRRPPCAHGAAPLMARCRWLPPARLLLDPLNIVEKIGRLPLRQAV